MAPNTPRKPTNTSPYKSGGSRPTSQLGVGTGVPPGGGDAAPKSGMPSGKAGGATPLPGKGTGAAGGKPGMPGANPKGAPDAMTTPQFQGDHPNAEPYNGPIMKVEGGSFVPQINLDSMPELDTDVSIEFCLESMARVLTELAENQEDPIWVQAHLTLAQEWHGAAATLLQHRVDMESTRGEVELKQQQLVHNDMDHQQKFAQQDQLHQQNIKHQDSMNQMNMQHQDQMNKMGMQNTQAQNQVGMQQKQLQMKQQGQFGDQKNKMALQQQKEIHQTKMQHTKQTHQTRLQQMKQRATQSATKKPAPKKG